jgi:hypothetical protein
MMGSYKIETQGLFSYVSAEQGDAARPSAAHHPGIVDRR